MIRANASVTLSAVVDVERVTRWYLLQSSTLEKPARPVADPPGGSWNDAEPGYTSGSTNSLYFVDCTEFSDGAWAYSEVSLSSAYEAAKQAYNKAASAESGLGALTTRVTTAETTISQTREELALKASQETVDGLRVGGRNYLLESAAEASASSYLVHTYAVSEPLVAGETYTLSLCVTPAGDVTAFGAWMSTTKQKQGQVSVSGTDKQIVSFTFTASYYPSMTPDDNPVNAYVRIYRLPRPASGAAPGPSTIHWAKLEKGNRATDWTPAPEEIERRVSAAETSLTLKADSATLASARDGLQSQIDAVPGQISLAVSSLEVGGTNLLSGTRRGFSAWEHWLSHDSASAWNRVQEPIGNVRRYTAQLDDPQELPTAVFWTYPTFVPLAAGQRYTLSTRVANYGSRVYFRYGTSQDGATFTDAANLDSDGLPGYADGFHTYTYTFTAPVTAYYRFGILAAAFSGDIDLIDTWKLELGEKATDWSPCPADPASSLAAGTTVSISKDEFRVSTPLFAVDTHSEEGYLRVSPTGVETGFLTASNVPARYDGPAAITVNASAASDGLSSFRTLTDALAALSGKWLDYDVSVSVATNTSENLASLRGVYGPGSVTVSGGGHTFGGRLLIANCASVFFENLTVSCAGAVVLAQALRVQSLVFSGCSLVGNAPSASGSVALEAYNASVRVSSCGVYGVRMGLAARIGGNIYVNGCSGSCGVYALVATADGKIGIETGSTLPAGASAQQYTQGGGQIVGTGASSSGTAPAAPVATTTATFAPAATKTRNTASGWLSGTASLQQGLLGSGNSHVGALWFDLSSLSGKTVRSASLTLTRLKRFSDGTYVDGVSGPVSVYAETATVASSASGSTGLGTVANQSEIGRMSPGSTVAMALPPAAVQAIVEGTAKALVVYAADSALLSGKSYSANYAAFAGRGETGAPVLSVTYS